MTRLLVDNPDLPHCILLFEQATGIRDPLISMIDGWADAVVTNKWVTYSNPQRTVGHVDLPDVNCEIEIIHDRLDDDFTAVVNGFEQSESCRSLLEAHGSAIAVTAHRLSDSPSSTNLSVANFLLRFITACDSFCPIAIAFPHGRVAWATGEFLPLAAEAIQSDDVVWFISSKDVTVRSDRSRSANTWFRSYGLSLFDVPDIACGIAADRKAEDCPDAVREAFDSLPAYLVKLGGLLPVGDRIELGTHEWLVQDNSVAHEGIELDDVRDQLCIVCVNEAFTNRESIVNPRRPS